MQDFGRKARMKETTRKKEIIVKIYKREIGRCIVL
jgi:hypothetical protein